jgi:hypothetical protein
MKIGFVNVVMFPDMDTSYRKWREVTENVPEIEETKLNLYQRQMPQHKVLFRRGAALKFSLR